MLIMEVQITVKKVILVALTVVLTVCLLVSCSIGNETTDVLSEEQSTNIQETDKTDYIVEERSTRITDIDEYGEYLKANAKLLQNYFITYGELRPLGEFVNLVIPVSGDHSYYLYNLKDSTGFLISVAITHIDASKDVDITKDSIVLQSRPSNLVLASDYRLQKVVFNNIRYSYDADGDLIYATTYIKDIKITFSPGEVFVPDSSGTSGKFVAMKFSEYKCEDENLLTCILDGNKDNKDLSLYLDK